VVSLTRCPRYRVSVSRDEKGEGEGGGDITGSTSDLDRGSNFFLDPVSLSSLLVTRSSVLHKY
jgi:hypothetical protein